MPRVQTYGAPQVGPASTTQARFRAADFGAAGEVVGRGAQNLSNTMREVGEQQAKTRADDLLLQAETKFKEVRNGFKAKSGRDAADAVGGTKESIGRIYDEVLGAADPVVRKYAEPRLKQYRALYDSDVGSHAIEQENVYQDQVGISRMTNFAENAKLSWDKPDLHTQFIESGKEQLRLNLSRKGLGDPEIIKAEERKYITGIRLGVVDQLLASDRQDDAIAYGEAHADELTADGQANLDNLLKAPKQLRFAISAADKVFGAETAPNTKAGAGPAYSSSSYFKHGIVPIEGGTDKNGAFLTSPKGAIGPAQVMPGTAPEAAKLAGLPYDEKRYKTDPAYNLAIGQAYYNQQLKTYGDPVKAAAAYNAGPGRVNEAVATAKQKGGSWQDHVPAETKKYIASFKKRMGIAAPVDGVDEADVYARLDAVAQSEGWTPEQKKLAQEEVDRRVSRVTRIKAAEQNDAYDAAVSKAVALGDNFTDVSQIGSAYNLMTPQQQMTIANMAHANVKAKVAAEAPKAYGDVFNGFNNMSLYVPQEFMKTNLAPYRNQMTPAEYSKLTATQARLQAGGDEVSRRASILSTISFYSKIDKAELDPKSYPENFTRVFDEMDTFIKDVTGGKRKPTDEELKAAYQRATMTVVVPGAVFGMRWPNEKRRFEVDPGQEFKVEMSDAVRNKIIAAARARGRQLTENQITQAYIAGKGKDW